LIEKKKIIIIIIRVAFMTILQPLFLKVF